MVHSTEAGNLFHGYYNSQNYLKHKIKWFYDGECLRVQASRDKLLQHGWVD